MSANTELLNYVFQNAEMGADSIGKLMEVCDNGKFKSFLNEQYSDYNAVADECRRAASSMGATLKDSGALKKMEANMMIDVKTVADKSPDMMAGMLMQGSVMGIVQSERRLRQYEQEAHEDTRALAKKLLAIEDRNLKECRPWLGIKG